MRSPDSRARLDPLAFPSDTTFRFLLLILAVCGTSLFAFHTLYLGLHDLTDEIQAMQLCMERSRSAAEGRVCSASLYHAAGTWILAAFGVLILVAVAVYLLMPSWKLRRRRLEPLGVEDAPDVVARLVGLASEAGLQTPPRFVWNPLNRAASGLAFGRVGRRYVAFGGGLVVTFYTDPEAFRAIVLHEFGHLRNRDVDKTYFTMALWYAFLAVAVLPLLVSLYGERLAYVWSISWRLAVLVVLVYLARNAVLRAREAYADVRASQSRGGAPALARVIGALPVPRGGDWRRLLSVHPDPRHRAAVIDNTDLLLHPGLGEAFGAGVMLTLIYGQLVLLIHYFGASLTGQYWLAALAVAPFCAGVVTLGVWRGVFLSLARPTTTRRVRRLGAAFGVGFLAGEVLSLQTITSRGESSFAAATGLPTIRGVVGSALFGPGIAWALLALLSLALLVVWLDSVAAVWLSRGGDRVARIAMVGAIVAGAFLLTVWTAIFFFLHDVAIPSAQAQTQVFDRFYRQIENAIWIGPSFLFRFVWDGDGLVLASYWPVIPAFALLWAFPLAAAASRRAGDWPYRAFLDADRPPALQSERLTVARAILIGLAAGLVAWAGTLILNAGVRQFHGVAPPLTDNALFGVFHWRLTLAVAAQPVAAAVAVRFCRFRPVLHGLLAGFAAGVTSFAALLAGRTIGSCLRPFRLASTQACPAIYDAATAKSIFDQVLAEGSALALAASLLTFGIVWLVRRWGGAARHRRRWRNRLRNEYERSGEVAGP